MNWQLTLNIACVIFLTWAVCDSGKRLLNDEGSLLDVLFVFFVGTLAGAVGALVALAIYIAGATA